MKHTTSLSTRPHSQPWRLAAAGALLVCTPWCLALGGGFLPPCPTFTTCSAAVASSVSWGVREDVSNIEPGFIMPSSLAPGLTTVQGQRNVATTAALYEGNGVGLPPSATSDFFQAASARAQSDFAVNRVGISMNRSVRGSLTRGGGSASVSLRTNAEASSAWRDVLAFSGSGRFSGVAVIDGSSNLGAVRLFGSSYVYSALPSFGDWFYDLRVWDVTNLSVSEDFELGGPTSVGRATLWGNNEVRPILDSSVALDFNFVSGVSYVLTAELRATSFDGREINLYNTARLQDVVLTGGATMSALSGYDYLVPVPEPQPAALWAAGLVALALWSRRRSARA